MSAPEHIYARPDPDDGWRWPRASKLPEQGPHLNVCYRRADLPPTLSAALAVPEVAALHLWAKDAQQALLDAMEEIIELRLTLGKSDLEPPWLSDAIDQSRATLRALDAISSADPVTKSS